MIRPILKSFYSLKKIKSPRMLPKTRCHVFLQVFEERPNYDLTQFVADMGGSLGFLLGLSVLGLIKILEKVSDVNSSSSNNDIPSFCFQSYKILLASYYHFISCSVKYL